MTTEPIDFKSDFKRPLPEGWRWVSLRDVLFSLETGSRPKGGTVGIRTGVPSISAEHMTRTGSFNFSTVQYVPYDFYKLMNRGRIELFDILVVKDGATTGKVVLVKEDFRFAQAVVNEHVFLCRPNPSMIEPYWLFYWLWSPEGQRRIRANFQGSAIGGISQSFVDIVLIPVPLISEQKRIAAILNEQMEAVQRARKTTQAQLEAAKALPAAYLRQVFPLFGEELPEGWQWMKLGVACEKNTGTRDPLKKPDKSFLYVDITSVDNIKKAIGTTKIIQGKDSPSRARKVIYKRDVIISTTRPNLNAVAMVPSYLDNQICSTGLCVLRATSELDCDYLFLFVKNAQFVENLSRLVTGALYPVVTDKQVFSEFIPLPPLSEQKRIAAILNEQMEAVGRLRTALEAQLKTINILPAALLRKAFNGEL